MEKEYREANTKAIREIFKHMERTAKTISGLAAVGRDLSILVRDMEKEHRRKIEDLMMRVEILEERLEWQKGKKDEQE